MTTISILIIGYALQLVDTLPSTTNSTFPIITTPPGQSTHPETEIGWQSLFWSLFALALLAMTQPSVLDSAASFPASSILYPARCSPIVCVTDTFEVSVRLAIEMLSGANLRTACTKICSQRNQATSWYIGEFSIHPKLNGPRRSAIKKHPIASVVVFLATLTQAIKIFGFRGVKWAQIIAACYLASYLVLAAIQLLAREEDVSEDSDEHTWSTYHHARNFQIANALGLASLFASFMMCSWALFKYNEDDNGDFPTENVFALYSVPVALFLLCSVLPTTLIRMGFALLALASITGPMIWSLEILRKVLTQNGSRRRLDYWLERLFATLWVCAILYLSVRYVYTYVKSEGAWGGTTTAAGILFTGLCALVFAILVLAVLLGGARKDDTHDRATIEGIVLVILSLVHLVVACLYFAYVFDPAGTVKPA